MLVAILLAVLFGFDWFALWSILVCWLLGSGALVLLIVFCLCEACC